MKIERTDGGTEFSALKGAGSETKNQNIAEDSADQNNRIPRYNPFTKSFEIVPKSWCLKRDCHTNEWHFGPSG